MLGTQNALETEQSVRLTQEFGATALQAQANTATAQANGVFTLNGTFSLVQTDSGCTFSDAPFTSGTIVMTVDFIKGTATATFTGGGGGTRSLSCQQDTGTMHWQQTYSVSVSGSIDPNSGALNLPGTINGNNNVSWSNCTHQGNTSDCPTAYAHGYTLKAQLSGTVDKTAHTGKGSWVVTEPGLATSGDWSAGK